MKEISPEMTQFTFHRPASTQVCVPSAYSPEFPLATEDPPGHITMIIINRSSQIARKKS